MNTHIAKKDIYDKNGVLLLGKGQKITDKVVEKLKRFGSYKPYDSVNLSYKQNAAAVQVEQTATVPILQAFGERMRISNKRILERPTNVVNTIIFDSKAEPWWIYVNTLGNYVDWVYTHSINVAMISLMIAEKLGYSDKELWDIGLGAFLHDVGKLMIPKDILNKPGSLSNIEMRYMQQHCELGMSSIKIYSLKKECTDVILQHHERLDGNGYPKGLKGHEICGNAKITMVADAIDAITTGRPYKKAEDIDSAIRMLKNEEEKYPQELISLLETILA